MPFEDFIPKFKKQEQFYKNEKLKNGRPWPYVKPVEQIHYEEWLTDVVDPLTQEFYTVKDPVTNKDETAKHKVQSIIRLQRIDGSEKLYTVGQLIGYNSFGDIRKTKAYKPEVFEQTKFGHKTGVDPKTNKLVKETTGPTDTVEHYILDFNEANLTDLFNKRDNNVQFMVKKELNGDVRSVKSKTLQSTFELFMSESFDNLFDGNYLTEEEKEDALRKSESLIPTATKNRK